MPKEVVAKRTRAKKNPNAPKRPASAFLLFSADTRPILKTELPGAAVPEVAKELGKRWKALDADGRKQYEVAAAELKKEYVVRKAAWDADPASKIPGPVVTPGKRGRRKKADIKKDETSAEESAVEDADEQAAEEVEEPADEEEEEEAQNDESKEEAAAEVDEE